jgi:hypothetical protein
LYPEFKRPTGTYFIVGLRNAAEIQGEVARIESADVIVLPHGGMPPTWEADGYALTPETEHALAQFKHTEESTYFSVYERR